MTWFINFFFTIPPAVKITCHFTVFYTRFHPVYAHYTTCFITSLFCKYTSLCSVLRLCSAFIHYFNSIFYVFYCYKYTSRARAHGKKHMKNILNYHLLVSFSILLYLIVSYIILYYLILSYLILLLLLFIVLV